MGGERGSGARGSGGSQNDGSGSGQDDDTYSSGYGWDDISFPKNDLTPWPPVVDRRPQPKRRPSGDNQITNKDGYQSATGSGAGRQVTRISALSWTSYVLSLLLVTISHWLCWWCCRVVVIINRHLFYSAWWRRLYAKWWRHQYLW